MNREKISPVSNIGYISAMIVGLCAVAAIIGLAVKLRLWLFW